MVEKWKGVDRERERLCETETIVHGGGRGERGGKERGELRRVGSEEDGTEG